MMCDRSLIVPELTKGRKLSMRRVLTFNRMFVTACLMLGLTVCLAAQTATTGELTGTVSDPTGALIPGVDVRAANTETAQERPDSPVGTRGGRLTHTRQ